jgi:hypothetical protein
MQALCLIVCLLTGSPDDRVRPLDPWAAEAIRQGVERSATVRELIAELERSDVIVHVETRPALPFATAGMTRLAAVTGTRRYLRVVLPRHALPARLVAGLGHELQHVAEIAQSNVRDGSAVRALYEAIGRRAAGEHLAYETEAALNVSRAVWYELHGDDARAEKFRTLSTH